MTNRPSLPATDHASGPRAARRILLAGLHLVLAAGLFGAAATAQAQWAWRDATGGTTYSDAPPPPDIRPEAILHRPGLTPLPAPGATASVDPGNPGAAPRPAGADAAGQPPKANAPKTLAEQDAEFRKRREERLKSEQKEADEAAKAAARQASCNEARSYLEMIQSGTRLMRPNPDGTRGYADDAGRAEETQKAQDRIAHDCQ
jgi:hypothetical protein